MQSAVHRGTPVLWQGPITSVHFGPDVRPSGQSAVSPCSWQRPGCMPTSCTLHLDFHAPWVRIRAWGAALKIERTRFQATRNSRSFSPKPGAFVVLGPPASRPMPFTFFTEARRDGYEGRGLEFVPFSRFLK